MCLDLGKPQYVLEQREALDGKPHRRRGFVRAFFRLQPIHQSRFPRVRQAQHQHETLWDDTYDVISESGESWVYGV